MRKNLGLALKRNTYYLKQRSVWPGEETQHQVSCQKLYIALPEIWSLSLNAIA